MQIILFIQNHLHHGLRLLHFFKPVLSYLIVSIWHNLLIFRRQLIILMGRDQSVDCVDPIVAFNLVLGPEDEALLSICEVQLL